MIDNGYNNDFISNLYMDCREFQKSELYDIRFSNIDDFLISKVKSSSKFEDILKDMDNRINNDINGKKDSYKSYSLPKLKYFCAHDTQFHHL